MVRNEPGRDGGAQPPGARNTEQADSPDGPATAPTRRERAEAALHAALTDSEAAATALRADLDALRHTLDVGSVPSPPPSPTATDAPPAPHPPSRRPSVRMLAVAVVLLLGLAGTVTMLVRHGSGAPGTTAGTAAAPTAAPMTTDPQVRALPWPGGPVTVPSGAATRGPGVDAPGSDVTAAQDPDGQHLDVYEQVIVDDSTGPGLRLEVPSLAGLKRPIGSARLTVEDLQAQVDGQSVATVALGGTRGWLVPFPAGSARTHVVLRYRVRGAIVRQTPGPPRRVTIVLAPLSGVATKGTKAPVNVRFRGTGISAMTCPLAATSRPLCGRRAGSWWVAKLPDRPVALVTGTRT